MKRITLGRDPAPPGKYKIKRIIADSDLDGLTSAAMLLTVYPEAQVMQADSADIISGKLDQYIDQYTATADLHYREGVGLYFDHHESSMPKSSDFPGRWQTSASAAHVVYDYFSQDYDLSKFAAMLPAVDAFDSAQISLADFLHPSPLMELALAIKRDQAEFNLQLVRYLTSLPSYQDVLALPDVQAKIKTMKSEQAGLFEHIKTHHVDHGELVFVDMTDFVADLKVSGYYFNSQFPRSLCNVVFKPALDGLIKVRLYQNAFNPQASKLNLLPIIAKLSTNGGGHPGACGYVSEPGESVAELEEKIIREFQRSNAIMVRV